MRLARMIDDLFELSRIEAEQTPLREPVPVHLVVAEAVEQVRTIAEREGSTCVFWATPHADRHRRPPADRLGVLQPARQHGEVLGARIVRRPPGDDRRGRLSGERRGPRRRRRHSGRDHERVFERFYRVDRDGRTYRARASVSPSCVTSPTISAARCAWSREGEGSTFTLVLPAGHRCRRRMPVTVRRPSPRQADSMAAGSTACHPHLPLTA